MRNLLRDSFRISWAHRKLVLGLYLAVLAPALAWALLLRSPLSAAFAFRPYSEGLLGPKALEVWLEYAMSSESHLRPVLGLWALMIPGAWLMHVLLHAGVVHRLFTAGETEVSPFLTGVRRFAGRFLRSGLIFASAMGVLVVFLGLGSELSEALIERTGDESWGYQIFAVQVFLALLLWVPLDLAYDLSRIGAVAHDGRRMLRGFLKALGHSLKRPRLWALYGCFLLLAVSVWLLFALLRSPLTPASAASLLLLLILQQGLLLSRSFLKVAFWAAEIGYYRAAGQPAWSGERQVAGLEPKLEGHLSVVK